MRQKIPKIITYAFYLQIALFVISLLILALMSGLDGLVAVYTLIPMVALAPIIALLAVCFPYREWKKYGSIFIGIAIIINVPIALIIFIRFVVLSFLLNAK